VKGTKEKVYGTLETKKERNKMADRNRKTGNRL